MICFDFHFGACRPPLRRTLMRNRLMYSGTGRDTRLNSCEIREFFLLPEANFFAWMVFSHMLPDCESMGLALFPRWACVWLVRTSSLFSSIVLLPCRMWVDITWHRLGIGNPMSGLTLTQPQCTAHKRRMHFLVRTDLLNLVVLPPQTPAAVAHTDSRLTLAVFHSILSVATLPDLACY